MDTTWQTDAAGVSYPPAPWRLEGDLYASVWRVPSASAPPAPPGAIPLVVAGQTLVVTGWAEYAPGGVLAYREALCAVLLRAPRFPAAAITHIWVDHPSSVAGGRALWSIPKVSGRFSGTPENGAAAFDADDRPIAALRFTPGLALPWRQRLGLHIIQQPLMGTDGPQATRLNSAGRIRFGHASWRCEPAGPLGFLHGRRPWFSARMERATLRFGV